MRGCALLIALVLFALPACREAPLVERSWCESPDVPCPKSQFCVYPDGECGQDDRPGNCRDIPIDVLCPDNWDPVCGCDGITHSNTCYLSGSSDLAYEGECR